MPEQRQRLGVSPEIPEHGCEVARPEDNVRLLFDGSAQVPCGRLVVAPLRACATPSATCARRCGRDRAGYNVAGPESYPRPCRAHLGRRRGCTRCPDHRACLPSRTSSSVGEEAVLQRAEHVLLGFDARFRHRDDTDELLVHVERGVPAPCGVVAAEVGDDGDREGFRAGGAGIGRQRGCIEAPDGDLAVFRGGAFCDNHWAPFRACCSRGCKSTGWLYGRRGCRSIWTRRIELVRLRPLSATRPPVGRARTLFESGHNCTGDYAVKRWSACYSARPEPIARPASWSDLNGST